MIGCLEMRKDYYKKGGIETLDFIKAKLTEEQYLGFCLGNVIKYASRDKNPDDLAKASFYALEVDKIRRRDELEEEERRKRTSKANLRYIQVFASDTYKDYLERHKDLLKDNPDWDESNKH